MSKIGAEQTIRTLAVQIPERLLPELPPAFGEFTTAHNLSVTIDGSDSSLVPYNTDLTSVVTEYDLVSRRFSNQQVVAVTRQNVKTFAPLVGESTNLGSLAFRGLSDYLQTSPEYKSYILATEKPGRDYPQNCWAIRAAQMLNIAELLSNDARLQNHLTARQTAFLHKFNQAFFTVG